MLIIYYGTDIYLTNHCVNISYAKSTLLNILLLSTSPIFVYTHNGKQ